MSTSPFIVAIDGPAASGKGTLARRLADEFAFAHLDTGLLYRAVGWSLVSTGQDAENVALATNAASALKPSDLTDPALRGDAAALAASKVATLPTVRKALLDFQRSFAKAPPDGAQGAVLDGRDIGTIVCPDASVKLFITASIEARAGRRVRELRERGLAAIHASVLAEMLERDRRDSTRGTAPLCAADDAITIDSSNLGPDAVFDAASEVVTASFASWRAGNGRFGQKDDA